MNTSLPSTVNSQQQLEKRAQSTPVNCQQLTANSGFIMLLVVVFTGVFLMSTSALAGMLLMNKKLQREKEVRESALHIAEAGLEYYKWHFAHYPNDLKDGTNNSGPYVHSYSDPEDGVVGTYSLSINGNLQCGQPTSVDITSVGVSASDATYPRSLSVRYARPSVAEYSYIVNTNVWAGSDRVITGKYHGNGGVRMDGANNSTVESSVSTWQCTSSFGCSSTQTKPGVFGAGTQPALWTYPTGQIDFAGISVDLAALKGYAKNNGGLYFAPLTGTASQRGYHLIFKSDGTVDVYKVTSTTQIWGYSDESGWQQENTIIASETFVNTYTIPSSCSVIFVEDSAWIEGTVKGKVTLAVADVTTANHDVDIVLKGNVVYSSNDGTDGLTALAERNVLIGLTSPDAMTLNGIFIAQLGRYGRNYYTTSGSNEVPSTYDAYVTRTSLTTVGSIVSNGRTGTQWTCGGTFCGGYASRIDSYDGRITTNPPPFTPYTSTDYTFKNWRDTPSDPN